MFLRFFLFIVVFAFIFAFAARWLFVVLKKLNEKHEAMLKEADEAEWFRKKKSNKWLAWDTAKKKF